MGSTLVWQPAKDRCFGSWKPTCACYLPEWAIPTLNSQTALERSCQCLDGGLFSDLRCFSLQVLNDIFSQGYQDTALFLYRNSKCHPKTWRATSKRDAHANLSPFFPCLTDAFGFNYFDGNFRFASMCGKNDSAQSNRTCAGLCKRVPQCLIPCFLPGRGFGVLILGFGGAWGHWGLLQSLRGAVLYLRHYWVIYYSKYF